MYAIIRSGGRQFTVKAGDVLLVDRLGAAEGSHVFDEVLLLASDAGVVVGQPTIAGATVSATIVGEHAAKKVIVFKRKKRKGYKKTRGHRQLHSRVKIDSITG